MLTRSQLSVAACTLLLATMVPAQRGLRRAQKNLEQFAGVFALLRAGKASVAAKRCAGMRVGTARAAVQQASLYLSLARRAASSKLKLQKAERRVLARKLCALTQALLWPAALDARRALTEQRVVDATTGGGVTATLLPSADFDGQLACLAKLRSLGCRRELARVLDLMQSTAASAGSLRFLRGELLAQEDGEAESLQDRGKALALLGDFVAKPAAAPLDAHVRRLAIALGTTKRGQTAVELAQRYLKALKNEDSIPAVCRVDRSEGSKHAAGTRRRLKRAIRGDRSRCDPSRMEAGLLDLVSQEPCNALAILWLAEVYGSKGRTFDRQLAIDCFERFHELTTDEGLDLEGSSVGNYQDEDLCSDYQLWYRKEFQDLCDLRLRASKNCRALGGKRKLIVLAPDRQVAAELQSLARMQQRLESIPAEICRFEKEIAKLERARIVPGFHGANFGGAISQLKNDIRERKNEHKRICKDYPDLDDELEYVQAVLDGRHGQTHPPRH